MSWAEVKKINSDLTAPINISGLIDHIDLVGNTFVGNGDQNILRELVKADTLYIHPTALDVVLSITISTTTLRDSSGYICVCKMCGLAYQDYSSWEDILNSPSAMASIFANYTATKILLSTVDAFASILENATSCVVLFSVPTALALVFSHINIITTFVSSAKGLNSAVKSPTVKTAIIENAIMFNAVHDIMLATLNAAASLFTKSPISSSATASSFGIGTANSFVDMLSVNDGTINSNYNWTSCKHTHNSIELIHSTFPSGSGQGNTTVNKFAVGGATLGASAAYGLLTYTATIFVAI